MDWDCCLFCNETKLKNSEEEFKHHPKKKQTKKIKKLKKLTRKLHYSSINLLDKICFWWKNLVIIINRQYSKYSKRTMQSINTIASQTISRN